MNAVTHVLGGYVLAGTLCSFTDVNVFENQTYIIACAAFAILPDIDTTKSAIGKMFYPLAWLINRKCGHRTITHSLLFLFCVWLSMYLLFRFDVIPNTDLVKIAVFSTISHFVFDMITLSGIPLLYPFFPNACVIPGNVNYRFKSGEWKSEILICGVCALLCFSMQPLFAQGFWNSYNRSFGTIRHVDRENRNTAYYVICEYSYILNAEERTGEAIVIDSKQNELILFDRREIFTLNSDNPQLKINHTRPRISTIEKRFEEKQFFNISFDSLQYLLEGKLASGLIQSNQNVQYVENAVTYHTNFIKFSNRFDFRIVVNADSGKTNIRANIARLEASINQSRQRHQSEVAKYKKHFADIAAIEDSLKSPSSPLSNYEKNKLQRELIKLKNRPIEEPVYIAPASQIAELEVHKKALTERNLLFSGHVTLYTFGFDHSGAAPHFVAKPIYDAQNVFVAANFYNSSNSLNP
jgi:inner membrane protein